MTTSDEPAQKSGCDKPENRMDLAGVDQFCYKLGLPYASEGATWHCYPWITKLNRQSSH